MAYMACSRQVEPVEMRYAKRSIVEKPYNACSKLMKQSEHLVLRASPTKGRIYSACSRSELTNRNTLCQELHQYAPSYFPPPSLMSPVGLSSLLQVLGPVDIPTKKRRVVRSTRATRTSALHCTASITMPRTRPARLLALQFVWLMLYYTEVIFYGHLFPLKPQRG